MESNTQTLTSKAMRISMDGSVSVSNDTDVENQAQESSADTTASSTISTPPLPRRGSQVAGNSTSILPAPIAFNYKATKAPKDTLMAVYKTGEYKAALPLHLLVVQSFMAGIYIALAGHLYLAVEGGLVGAFLFPTGLIAVILTSAELFTGDALVFVASVLGGRVSFKKLVRNWTVSWILNFAGCLVWAFVMAYASDSLEDLGRVEFAIAVAEKKARGGWLSIFLKGIGANFMVCLGVWQATCAEEVAGKILALWFPISAFVILGFDHCIANQFLIPVGMLLGADIDISDMLLNALLPATLGNIFGGGILVGAVYWFVYDSMASSKQLFSGIRDGFFVKSSRWRQSIFKSRSTSQQTAHQDSD